MTQAHTHANTHADIPSRATINLSQCLPWHKAAQAGNSFPRKASLKKDERGNTSIELTHTVVLGAKVNADR